MPALSHLVLFHVDLPLKKPIRHASHERSTSDSLVVQAILDDGSVGFGEGVPRPYVTGETIATAFDVLQAADIARAIGRPLSFAAAVEAVARLTLPTIEADPRGMNGNAARSAVELALLDAFGHAFRSSAGLAVRIASRNPRLLRRRPRWVRYSGAITAEEPAAELKSAWKMWLNGFHQVKLKVGVAGQDDARRLARVRAILGRTVDIRLDANESWSPAEVVDRVRPLLPYAPSVIEQPVPHADVDLLAELRPRIGLPIMLDESLCGYPDGVRAVDRGLADYFNVRISKCGGLIPTLRLVELATASGLGVQLGCHPGESGLLSAAGRHLATNLNCFRYLEGSYDRHVLKRNVTRQDPTFTIHGLALPIRGAGLGVSVDLKALDAMTVSRKDVSYE